MNLQKDLDALPQWCEDNLMTLNIDKCKSMSFTTERKLPNSLYTIHDIPFESVDNFVDLGITFSKNGSFKSHIDKMVNQACWFLGLIFRNFNNVSP